MSRNSSGTYTPTAGQPVVSGTVITSTAHNALVSDLSTEITDSLSRSGKGGMLAPVRTPDGTVAAPAQSFNSETGTGWFRIAAGRIGAAILGVLRLEVNASGLTIPNALTVTGDASVAGANGVTVSGGDITLDMAGTQILAKTGSGDLTVGTKTAATGVNIMNNNAGTWFFQSTGKLQSAGGTIWNLPTPTTSSEAATKGYVDTVSDGTASISWGTNWSNGGSRLVKMPNGVVVFTMHATTGGSPGSVICVLPSGYRPAVTVYPVGISQSAFRVSLVESSGNVTFVGTLGSSADLVVTFWTQ